MPSLKPNRLRGVAWRGRGRRRPAEAELRPAHARPCRSRSGPGCGWRARRPAGRRRRPGRRGRRRTAPGRGCRRGSAAAGAAPRAAGRRGRTGPRRPRPEQRRPEAEGERQPDGGRPIASPVSSGGASYGPSIGADPPGVRALRSSAAAASVQSCSSAISSSRDVGGDVERGEVQPVLGRGDDAGLVLAVERRSAARSAPAVAGRRRAPSPRQRRRRRPPRRRPAASARRAGDGRAGAARRRPGSDRSARVVAGRDGRRSQGRSAAGQLATAARRAR